MKNPFAKKQRASYGSYDEGLDGGFYRGEEEEGDLIDDFAEEEAAPATTPAPKKKAAPSGGKVRVIKPRSFNESPEIVDALMDGYKVFLDIAGLDRNATMRLIDFSLGALHVLGGELCRVSQTTLILSPRAGEIVNSDAADGADDEYDI